MEDKPLVVIVDDDKFMRYAMKRYFAKFGVEVQALNNGFEVLLYCTYRTPDLIISDINLQGRSGLELCEQIKQDEALANVPIMFLSGAQIPDVIRRSHAVGGTYYLRKPFERNQLLGALERALRR